MGDTAQELVSSAEDTHRRIAARIPEGHDRERCLHTRRVIVELRPVVPVVPIHAHHVVHTRDRDRLIDPSPTGIDDVPEVGIGVPDQRAVHVQERERYRVHVVFPPLRLLRGIVPTDVHALESPRHLDLGQFLVAVPNDPSQDADAALGGGRQALPIVVTPLPRPHPDPAS